MFKFPGEVSLKRLMTLIKTKIDPIQEQLDNHVADDANPHGVTAAQINAVPDTRTVNGKALSSDITLSASDVGALPTSTTIPTKTSQLTNDSGYRTTDDNTTYSLSKSGSTITLTGSDGSTTSVTDSNTTYTLESFGVTATKDELNKLDGVTATTTEINKLDGLTATTTELNRLVGVTSGIQEQLNSKAATSAIPTKTSQLTNDSGYITSAAVNNTTYSLSKSGSTITLTGSDGSTTNVTDSNTTYSDATQSAAGLLSTTDKKKLDGIAEGANKYSLPTATSDALGGVKVGSNITNTSGTISLTKANVTSALGYTPPTSDTTYGVVSTTADGLAPKRDGSTTKFLRADGTWAVPPNDDTTYTFNGAVSTIKDSNLTANRALISNASGKVAVSAITSTELGYLDNVTSNVQEQLNNKVPTSRTVNTKPLSADISLSASDVGAIPTSAKGAANGVAELDSSGKVPTSQLPSYVDDVVEGTYVSSTSFKNSSGTAITGETGKIYVDTSTNKTYRWSGSAFVEISASLALGTTSSTAYYGDKGKTAYDHSQMTSGNPHNVTKTDIGLGNVENKSSATIRGELTKANVTTALGYTPPTTNTTYSNATASTAGLIKVSSVNSSAVTVNSESTTSGRYYPVELNSDGKAIVNVPWTDTNTDRYVNHTLSRNGDYIQLTVTDVAGNKSSESSISAPNTTYSLSKSGSTITLTGSDGSTTSVTDTDTEPPESLKNPYGLYFHNEGQYTHASYDGSEDVSVVLVGKSVSSEPTAEVFNDYDSNTASAGWAHAEGYITTASETAAHAEGGETTASGMYSHAEGHRSTASAFASHAEGYTTNATNQGAHAEGSETTASGVASHAEGSGTKASSNYQHVQGKYNIEDTAGTYAHIVGNGYSDAPSNAHTIDWEGNAWFAGDIYLGGTGQDSATDTVAKASDFDKSITGLSASGKTITYTKGDGTTGTITTQDTNTTYSAAGSSLGLVKSGGDVTISSGVITVNDDSHNHTIANVDGLQTALDNAEAHTDTAYDKVISRGEQLIVNGNGIMGNDTNFSKWTFDGAVANNSPGSFTYASGSKIQATTDEFFPVNPANKYKLSLDFKSKNGLARMYSYLSFYDADKLEVNVKTHTHNSASTTTLAKDLKTGDTLVYLTDVSGWSTSYNYGFYLRIWNYTNSFGYTYPAGTYTRNSLTLTSSSNKLTNLDTTNKTVTLTAAYSGATIPAGTEVSQGGDAATYKYIATVNTLIPTTWQTYSATIGGVDLSGGNAGGMFPPGTAYAKLGFLWNNNTAADQVWMTNVSVTDVSAFDDKSDVGHTHTVTHTPAGTVTVTPNTTTVNSITAVGTLPSLTYTADKASEITAWSAGSAPSLTYSAVEPSKITAWSAGTLPSLTFGAGTLPSASHTASSLTGSVSNQCLTLTFTADTHSFSAGTLPSASLSAGTLPSLTYSKVDADNITAWSAGSVPSLTYTSVDVDNITAWSAGTLPTKGSNTTVVTGIKSTAFTGTSATLTTSADS